MNGMGFKRALLIAGKGGTGKTTLAISLAVHWVKKGLRVGILDANLSSPDVPVLLGLASQGIEGLVEGIEPSSPVEGLKVVSMGLFLHRPSTPVSWRGPVRHGVLKQFVEKTHWGDLELLVVDLPPGIGEELLTLMHLLRDKGRALLVATGSRLSLLEAERLRGLFQQGKIPVLGWVKNMPQGEGKIDLPLLGTLPFDRRVQEGAQRGEALLWHHPGSPYAHALEEIAKRCLEALRQPSPSPITVTARLVWRGG